jgi:hypothetical protein
MLGGLVAVAIIAAVLGLFLDVGGFLGNLAAEVVGVAASIVLAVLAVDVLLERRRRQRWDDVRDQTLRAIYVRVGDLMVDAMLDGPVESLMRSQDPLNLHPGEARDERFWDAVVPEDPASPGAVEAMEDLAAFLRENSEQLAHHDDDDAGWASSRLLYDEVHEEISQLRDVLTPRVLELADDPELVSRLLALEKADRSWRSSLWLIEKGWGMPDRYGWQSAASVYDAAAAVARHLSETYFQHLPPDHSPPADRSRER